MGSARNRVGAVLLWVQKAMIVVSELTYSAFVQLTSVNITPPIP
jgi:hypothetical protein